MSYSTLYTYLLWSTLLSLPMFATGLSGFDFHPHQRLAWHFDALLHEGIGYPRWLPEVNHGYGNPTFIFYNPLFYYVVSACRLLVPGIEGAMYLAAFLGFFLSGLAMYRFAREYLPPKAAAWAGLAYILLPYHVMNLYSRTALAEFWAMVWMPLVLTGTIRLRRGDRSALAGTALSYAALVYTHLATAFLFSLFWGAYIFFLCRNRWQCLLQQALAGALGLGLGSAFLLPALLEQPYVQIHLVRDLPWGNPLENFLFFRPPYGIGFGLEVGIGAVLTLIVFLAAYWILQRGGEGGGGQQAALFFIGAGLVSLMLMTCLSWPLWRYLPFLPSVQFPWRLLTVATLCAAFSVGAAFNKWASGSVSATVGERRLFWKMSLLLLLVPSLLWLGFAWLEYQPPALDPRRLTLADVRKHMSREELRRIVPVIFADRSWDILEFRPIWAPLALATIAPPISWTRGNGKLVVEQWNSLRRIIRVETRKPGSVKLRTFYYPGWTPLLDGEPAAFWPDPEDGSITVGVLPGNHRLEITFLDTPLRRLSGDITLATLIGVIAGWLLGRYLL